MKRTKKDTIILFSYNTITASLHDNSCTTHNIINDDGDFFNEKKYIINIINNIIDNLTENGYNAQYIFDNMANITPIDIVKEVNKYCKQNGDEHVIFISFHFNYDGQYEIDKISNHKTFQPTDKNGWAIYSNKKNDDSDMLAQLLYFEAVDNFTNMNIINTIEGEYAQLEDNFYILDNIPCIGVLSKNFYIDNKNDLNFLMSDKGKTRIEKTYYNAIIKFFNLK